MRPATVDIGVRSTWRDILFLALVAVLPLHTVFLEAWISWKPYLVILIVLAAADLATIGRERAWPWHPQVSIAAVVFGATVLVGFPAPVYRERFLRLLLALAVGALVMLVSARRLERPGMLDRTLGVVFWSGAAIAATGIVVELIAVGAFGPGPIELVNDLPGVFRVFKPAYLEEGFLALTNWHQDPGYSAAWAVLWSVLALFAVFRGRGSGRWWLDGIVVGGLGFVVVAAFSRTGWISWPVALAVAAAVLVRRWQIPVGEILRRLAVALLTVVVILAGVWSADRHFVGGDLDLQFAFRLSQGWDLLASITGLFSASEAFQDRFDVSEERADVWPEYVAFFREHPVTGVGLGVGWESTSITQELHNLLLELLGETGLLGFAGFVLLLATILRHGRGAIGAVALVTAFLPSMTQTVLFEPTWWFAAALFLAGRSMRSPPE